MPVTDSQWPSIHIESIQLQDKAPELEAIIAALAEAVVMHGPAEEMIRLDAAAESLLGYSGERGSSILEQLASLGLQTPKDKRFASEETLTARALRSEIERGVVGVIPGAATREPVWVSISAAPVSASSGKPRGGEGG